jgi:site-specific recombinase XerD
MNSENVKKITNQAIEQLITALNEGRSETLTQYLAAIGRFHRYSLRNVMLIASQKPTATHVAGFHAWHKLGRIVKKGEKGILILAPIVRRKNESAERNEIDESSTAVGFRAAYVFDISQTDGQELPEIGSVNGDPRDCRERLEKFVAEQSIALEYSDAGGRTYTEGFRLRWDQIDWENRLIRFGNDVKTPGSSEPLPLTDLAFRVLRKWKEESKSDSPFIFPSPRKPGRPIRSVKTAWRATLKRASVPHFPIYNLRHAFCTRLSWVAPDAIIQRAMRHTSPETKRRYQLGMVEQVREAMEKANQQVYGESASVN